MTKRLILDTHVWLWFVNGDETLKKTVRDNINSKLAEGKVGISAISVWEVGMLVKKRTDYPRCSLFRVGRRIVGSYRY